MGGREREGWSRTRERDEWETIQSPIGGDDRKRERWENERDREREREHIWSAEIDSRKGS